MKAHTRHIHTSHLAAGSHAGLAAQPAVAQAVNCARIASHASSSGCRPPIAQRADCEKHMPPPPPVLQAHRPRCWGDSPSLCPAQSWAPSLPRAQSSRLQARQRPGALKRAARPAQSQLGRGPCAGPAWPLNLPRAPKSRTPRPRPAGRPAPARGQAATDVRQTPADSAFVWRLSDPS
jgi:hypothetical protein